MSRRTFWLIIALGYVASLVAAVALDRLLVRGAR
jgi:hypothetical protein